MVTLPGWLQKKNFSYKKNSYPNLGPSEKKFFVENLVKTLLELSKNIWVTGEKKKNFPPCLTQISTFWLSNHFT